MPLSDIAACRTTSTPESGLRAIVDTDTHQCPYRKSNPYVLMVQPSKNGPHLDAPGALNEPSN
ncbi:MAG: hypothetical protein WCD25_07610, partial [Pseudolabrys sp.]